MHDVKLLNKSKKIVGLSWIGKVTPEDVKEANGKLGGFFKELNRSEFDLLVDMRGITVLFPETQKEIVKHQEWLLKMGMKRAAVVVDSPVAKLQLRRTAKESSHEKEFHFNTVEEAMAFLSSK